MGVLRSSLFLAAAALVLVSCAGACPSGEFECDNGNCVPYRYRDDSDNDCGDWSDERHHSCRSSQFTCANKDCVNAAYVCDGDADCRDGSDEADCGVISGVTELPSPPPPPSSPPVSCGSDEMRCDNGLCVPLRYRDDSDNDCGDWSDEPGHSCGSGKFTCANRNCVNARYVCDGDDDCADGSDEEGCHVTEPQLYDYDGDYYPGDPQPGPENPPSHYDYGGDYPHDYMGPERMAALEELELEFAPTTPSPDASGRTGPTRCPLPFQPVDELCVGVSSMVDPKLFSWEDAHQICQSVGGYLMTFEDAEQLIRVLRYVDLHTTGSDFPFWVGLSATANTTVPTEPGLQWKWADGRVMEPTSSFVKLPGAHEVAHCGRLESARVAVISTSPLCHVPSNFLCQTLPLAA